MSTIFEDEQNDQFASSLQQLNSVDTRPWMISLLIRQKIAKNERQAFMILLGIVIISIIVVALLYGIFILHIGQSKKEGIVLPPGIPYDVQRQIERNTGTNSN